MKKLFLPLFLTVSLNCGLPVNTKILTDIGFVSDGKTTNEIPILYPVNEMDKLMGIDRIVITVDIQSDQLLNQQYILPVSAVIISQCEDFYTFELKNDKGIISKIYLGANSYLYNIDLKSFQFVQDMKLNSRILGLKLSGEYEIFYIDSLMYQKKDMTNVYDISIDEPHIYFIADSNDNFIMTHNMSYAIRFGSDILKHGLGAARAGGGAVAGISYNEYQEWKKDHPDKDDGIVDQYGKPYRQKEDENKNTKMPPVGISTDLKMTGTQVEPSLELKVKRK